MNRRLRKIERSNFGEVVEIPQKDGTVLRFSEDDREAAWVHEFERMRRMYGGEDPGPKLPFTVAQHNAAYPDCYARNHPDAESIFRDRDRDA